MNKLKAIRGTRYTQKEVAEILGISRSTIAMWETSKTEPNGEHLLKLSNLYNVSINFLLGNDEFSNLIPVLGSVSAGEPSMTNENILDYIEVNPKIARRGDHFALYIKGQSMIPVLNEGDIIIIKKQPSVESGKIAVVLINGDEATVKQVWKNSLGITLTAFNSSVYQPTTYSNEDIENKPVSIIGVVVESRRNFSCF